MKLSEIRDVPKFNHLTAASYASRFPKQDIDYGNLFFSNLENKLSVIAKYVPPAEFAGLDATLQAVDVTFGEFYYGVSPRLDSYLIIRSISELKFSDADSLDRFISEHHDFYMLHKGQEAYLPHLARYITLAVASNYGILFKKDERLIRSIERTGCCSNSMSQIRVDQNTGKELIAIKGCPTHPLLDELDRYRYRRGDQVWEICDGAEGLHIYDIYADKSNIRLINGDVFYSGVLLKPVCLSVPDDAFENVETRTLCFHFEKSTYATVFALDGNYLDHPILNATSRSSIIHFLTTDDQAKETLIKELENAYGNDAIDVINRYLKDTFNVNQVGVSANIITRDGVLLLGRRSSKAIDNGALYPGVNGNAEVEDPAVSFYHYSVYEDFPTIHTESPRVDFLGEISREAYAELRLDVNKQDWTCLGVTLSGNHPTIPKEEVPKDCVTYDAAKRRMHFNILFEATCHADYFDIVKSSSKAEEKFENAELLGLSVNCFQNKWGRAIHSIGKLLGKFVDMKDVIEALLLVMTALLGTYIATSKVHLEHADILSLVLAVSIIGIYFTKAIGWIRKTISFKRTVSKITVYFKNSIEKTTEKIDKMIKKYECHPVAYLSVKLHVYNQLSDLTNEAPAKRKKAIKKRKKQR